MRHPVAPDLAAVVAEAAGVRLGRREQQQARVLEDVRPDEDDLRRLGVRPAVAHEPDARASPWSSVSMCSTRAPVSIRSSPVASARAMTVRSVDAFAPWWQTLFWQNPQYVQAPRPSNGSELIAAGAGYGCQPSREAASATSSPQPVCASVPSGSRACVRRRTGCRPSPPTPSLPLDQVVERLELVVGERPVGDRRALRDRAGSVALLDRAAAPEVPRQEADAQPVVVHGRAADGVHHERRPRRRPGLSAESSSRHVGMLVQRLRRARAMRARRCGSRRRHRPRASAADRPPGRRRRGRPGSARARRSRPPRRVRRSRRPRPGGAPSPQRPDALLRLASTPPADRR